MKFEWKEIYFDRETAWHKVTYRAKVFGGWLVHHWTESAYSDYLSDSITFVPDPLHEWKIEDV